MEDHSPEALQKARDLRRQMSLPEVLLWRQLRVRPMGLKFRRQHPVGHCIADLYCASAKVLIEIDGRVRGIGSRAMRDEARDRWLRQQGYRVLRGLASDVLEDSVTIAESLAQACLDAPPPSVLRAATSPRGGGLGW